MPKNKYCVVYDYETDGLDLETLNVVQIAAIPINLFTLEIEDNPFNIDVQVPSKLLKSKEYSKAHWGAISKHMEWQGVDQNTLFDRWSNGLPVKDAFKAFIDYCSGFNHSGPPVCGGQNIVNYDNPITKKWCGELNLKYPFKYSEELDLKYIIPLWTMFSLDPPKNHKMDTLRPYFGLDEANAHDALKDVYDTANLISRFLKLHQRFIKHVPTLYREL